jgi:hypothetical protein
MSLRRATPSCACCERGRLVRVLQVPSLEPEEDLVAAAAATTAC